MRAFQIAIAAALLTFGSGCIPGVAWLPDSSGFIYTTTKGHLVVYDCKAKKQRVILEDAAAATTAWPALSPDGKKIALAHLGQNDQKEAVLQFVLCDLQGRIESRSEKLKLAAIKGKDFEFSTQVVWSPDAKKLLIHGQGNANEGDGFDNAALFDVATKKMEVWENQVPAYFGSTPIRPDGAGFLLASVKSTDRFTEYTWVDWAGKMLRIARAKNRQEGEESLAWTAIADSRWNETKAIVTFPKHRYVFDTKMLSEKIDPVPPAETMIGKEAIRMRARMASGIELLLLVHDDGGKDGPAMRVVARKKGDAKLTEAIAPFRDRLVLLNASPDRTRAIVRIAYGYRGAKGDTIHVLDDSGKRSDTIDVYGEFVKK
jgi:hypothetical protein